MILPELRRGGALVASVACCCAASACNSEDPPVWDKGPTFLIVAPAARQPSAAEGRTAIFVQARGGSFVSIVTYGGKHRYTTLAKELTTSCAELPGAEPLYLLVKPDEAECTLEARLYAECDESGDAAVTTGVCGVHDPFVASTLLTIVRPDLDGGLVASDVTLDRTREAGDAAVEADR